MSFQKEIVLHGRNYRGDNMILVDVFNKSKEIHTMSINENDVSIIDKDTVGVWKIKGHRYKFPFDNFENTRLKAINKFSVF